MDLRRRYRLLVSRLFIAYARRRFSARLVVGPGTVFYGLPLLRLVHGSSCLIGSDGRFVSVPSANLVGLTRKCSIAVMAGARLSIGDRVGFSAGAIVCAADIRIGNDCNFGGNVSIWDTDFHPVDWQQRRAGPTGTRTAPIVIGNDVFVGAHTLILKGATIGDRAVIGAGSVVTGHVPADEIWAGNPARLLRKIQA